jgi:hypothetical protein
LDTFCLQAGLAFIGLITSVGGPLCRFAVCTQRKWQKVLL